MAQYSRGPKGHESAVDPGAQGDGYALVLQAAIKVSEIATSALPLPDALAGVVREAMALLRADQGSVMLRGPSPDSLVLLAGIGLPPEAVPGMQVPVGESVAGRVLVTGRGLLLGDVQPEAFVNFIPKSRPVVSSVVVPLRVRGRTIGVLSLGTGRAGAGFGDRDLRIAQLFADQAAGTIYIAREHERAQTRSSDLMTLTEATKGLIGNLDVGSILQVALDGGNRLLGSDTGFVCLLDPETGAVSTGVFRGIDKTRIGAILSDPAVAGAVDSASTTVVDGPDGSLVAAGVDAGRGGRGLLVFAVGSAFEREQLLGPFAQQVGMALASARLHELVQRKEVELGAIAHGVPVPIVLADVRGRVVTVNTAAEELFNISSQFASGLAVRGNLRNAHIEDLLLGEGTLQSEVVAGNPPRTFKVRVADVSAPGVIMGRVLMMDDISTERDIAQRQRDFVAMIGHELRTPLTIIKGFASMQLRRGDRSTPAERAEALTMINARAAQLNRLIDDLLYVSKIESREAAVHVEAVAVRDLVASVAQELAPEHPGREVRVAMEAPITWHCDEAKLGLVVRHLLDNALKYSEAPSPVIVRLREEGDELRLDVVDRGIGIVSSDVPTIFERFTQIDGSSTREHGGTGVGLYLCAQLMRTLEGRIWVDSTWGKGSTFSLSLPRRSLPADVSIMTSSKQSA